MIKPKLSIAVPAYNYHGKGSQFLDDLLRTIEIQTFKDFEVVISDHSDDNSLVEKVKEFENKFNINYFKTSNKRGNSPANLNYAIENCQGDIIKPMFQDDFFYDDEALDKIYYNLIADRTKTWLLCGTNHTSDNGNSFFWELYPRFNDHLLDGVNTVSSPSVLAFKKSVDIKFDENLVYLMDLDFYYSMWKNYEDPIYYDDILVSNRIHPDSISSRINNKQELIDKESNYCKEKYNGY
jgi:glycosyltransferase involved in cell wall biosynthesis